MMPYPIHDLYVRSLSLKQGPAGASLGVLRYSDHLLRRFGFAEIVFLKSDQIRPAQMRMLADEAWALIDGRAQFNWLDLRSSSPTFEATFQLDCDQPTLVLVPFGVEFEVRAFGGPAQLIRLATHEIGDE